MGGTWFQAFRPGRMCLIWALALSIAPAIADDAGSVTPPTVAAAASQPAAPATATPSVSGYRIEPGDTVTLTVLGESDYSGSYAVRGDRTIVFRDAMIGAVAVGGLTVQEASRELTARLGEYVIDPSVLLTITRFKVMVIGEVRKPGQYQVGADVRLAEVLDIAGGAKREADLDQVYVVGPSGEERRFSLWDFRDKGDGSQNPLVEPGDRISVGQDPKATCGRCRVTGAVQNPGSYALKAEGFTLISDIVAEAGRWAGESNPGGARLIRADGTEVKVDLTRLDEDPRSPQNLEVHDGDELFVPRNGTQVSVLGGVAKPGSYLVASGATLLEVVALAGGPVETAVLDQCAIVRCDPKPERISADLRRLVKDGDMSQNPVLKDRDVVFVPSNPAARAGSKPTLLSITDAVLRYVWLLQVF